ncbi:polyphenol oxidase E, chloroplastic-like [Lycium barbarum]|uniref:polyphenol oxidase E, chloroplastic-like n=1 Tax=Lycium barbarum TaxID=112863 RepID=UPI00293F23DD|nr:polyphenol oxidase E, chloroplastic-like [Lycium barbarum]
MASTTLPLCTNKTPSSSFPNSSFFAKPSKLFLYGKCNKSFKVSCMGSEHDKDIELANKELGTHNVDRRRVLLGLGGLYGAANLAPLTASASSTSIPDLGSCRRALIEKDIIVPYNCCPPKPENLDNIPYYELPLSTRLRVRPPAHAVDDEYIAKYELATRLMRKLEKDPSDPLGFKQQANIHCAYCNGAYTIGGKQLQVHQSWLFFPFHRWYLYFYERILGSLIDDPTFALPYWNWDNPKGMLFPPMFYKDVNSPLYDARRNPKVTENKYKFDLGSFGDEVDRNDLRTMVNNLTHMYRQMITNAPCPRLFFGMPYVLGSKRESKQQGTIENIPHTPVHIWTGTVHDSELGKDDSGKPIKSYGEDMGNFYSAALDPVFYCHHANVDRMWNEWKLIGGTRRDLTDKDWLNSEFFFYDEKRNPFRVKIRDCLDTKRMGYDYTPMPTLWRSYKPRKKITEGKVNTGSLPQASEVFPLEPAGKLDRAISFSINRQVSSRTQQEEGELVESLIFKGVKHDDTKNIRFDVFLNTDKTANTDDLDKVEFAGSYTSLPHLHTTEKADDKGVDFNLAITELLEDIGLENEKTIAVTLVPRNGGELITIHGVEINVEPCN